MPYSLVEIYWHLRGTCCLHLCHNSEDAILGARKLDLGKTADVFWLIYWGGFQIHLLWGCLVTDVSAEALPPYAYDLKYDMAIEICDL
jgi:hypothetical protein